MKRYLIFPLLVLTSACSPPPEVVDGKDIFYPIEKGDFSFAASLSSPVYLLDQNESPAMFKINTRCQLSTTMVRYGNESTKVIPISVYCNNPTLNTVIEEGSMSYAYIKGRVFDNQTNLVRFEVYDPQLRESIL